MIHGGREFSDIYDLVGIRILVEDSAACYAVMGVLHNRWTPIQDRFKDYVAMPKFNLYQSLHTTVIGPQGKPVEMQIRSWQMHRTRGVRRRRALEVQGGRARRRRHRPHRRRGGHAVGAPARRFQNEFGDAGEFLDSLRYEINAAQVYVFTPRGDVIQLPSDPTPVDFAYAIHTEVGHHTIGARVNGRLVPLESTLDNGDVVEVFTSKSPNAGPSRDWLTFVKSPRARSKIRHWFTKERREEAIEQGKDQIAKLLRKEGMPLKRVMTHDSLTQVASELQPGRRVRAVRRRGRGQPRRPDRGPQGASRCSAGEAGAEEDLSEATLIPRGRRRAKTSEDSGVIVKGLSDVLVKLARCCTPVPGDDIIGFVTKTAGVSVHRKDCTNAGDLLGQPERLVDVEWAPTSQSTFLVQIMVEALDRARLLSDITLALSEQHVNILSASLTTTRDRVAKSRFSFEMGDPKHLGAVLKSVRQIDGVFDAYRVTQ